MASVQELSSVGLLERPVPLLKVVQFPLRDPEAVIEPPPLPLPFVPTQSVPETVILDRKNNICQEGVECAITPVVNTFNLREELSPDVEIFPQEKVSLEKHDSRIDPSERELVDRARAGDRDAIGSIFDLYNLHIFGYVLKRVADIEEAEDITGQVFLRVIEYIGRFKWQENVPFSAWLFTIARNQVISNYRKIKPPFESNGCDIEDPASKGWEGEVDNRFMMLLVKQEMCNLPKGQQEVLQKRFGEGLSCKESAEALGTSVNNVKVQQHKAIAKLQKILKFD